MRDLEIYRQAVLAAGGGAGGEARAASRGGQQQPPPPPAGAARRPASAGARAPQPAQGGAPSASAAGARQQLSETKVAMESLRRVADTLRAENESLRKRVARAEAAAKGPQTQRPAGSEHRQGGAAGTRRLARACACARARAAERASRRAA